MEPLPLWKLFAPAAAVAALAAVCAVRNVPLLRAVLLGVAAGCGYAMVQDQVSARLCPEYYTVYHNPIPGLTDSTLLGLAWGFLGGWWGGVILGVAAGLSATAGHHPPLRVRELVRPMLAVFGAVAVVSATTGVAVWWQAERFGLALDPAAVAAVAPERHRWLFVVASYHFAAHATAALGTLALCAWIARERGRRTIPG